jgi:adenosylhomocysteinase
MPTQKTDKFWIKDLGLAAEGKLYCEEALKQMKGITSVRNKYGASKPLSGVRILGAGVVTYECANFVILLKDLGAEVRWVSDSLHYSIDSAAAYIASNDIPIFAFRHMSEEEYDEAYHMAMYRNDEGGVVAPDFIVSDGAEMPMFLSVNYPNILPKVKCILEQTTCGINKYRANFECKDLMNFSVIDINGSVTKSKFDNIYGSRESLLEGIQRSLNVQIAGEEVVVFGYGEVGKGCAQVLRGLGAHVSIVEIDPIMAMQSHMEGYKIVSKSEAVAQAKIIVTATGCTKTLGADDLVNLGNGCLLMNMSEHNTEIDTNFFKTFKFKEIVSLNENCKRYTLPNGNEIYLLCDGYVLNLYAGYGHPPTVMGTTYTTHALTLISCIKDGNIYHGAGIHQIPRGLDEEVARMSLPEIASKLTVITEEQEKYLGVCAQGPYKSEVYKY